MPISSEHRFSNATRRKVKGKNGCLCVYQERHNKTADYVSRLGGELDHILPREWSNLEGKAKDALRDAGYPKNIWERFSINSYENCVQVSTRGNRTKQDAENAVKDTSDEVKIALFLDYFSFVYTKAGVRRKVSKKTYESDFDLAVYAAKIRSLGEQAARIIFAKDKEEAPKTWDHFLVKEAKEYERQILKFREISIDHRRFERDCLRIINNA